MYKVPRKHRWVYVTATFLLLFIEVLIALFVHDGFIRPYVGDILVVGLIYSFCMSLTRISPVPMVIATLLFCFLVEYLQYLNFISWIGLEDVKAARIVLGSSFSTLDLVMYILGAAVIYACEWYTVRRQD